MASENKKRKLKNSSCVKGWLKNKTTKLKRLGFYNASKRAEDKKIDEKDFPEHGYFNWKTVKLKTPTKPYYDGHKIIGVVLHDGNFMTNGVLFLENQYEIIDEDPLKLNCL